MTARESQLAQALHDARAIRGTVMLTAVSDADVWCAACAAVDGTLEVRVNEPPRGGVLRPASRSARRALDALGFVPGYDCWQAPLDASSIAVARGARLLDQALPPGVELTEHLRQPGVSAWVAPPAPSAPHREHIAAAVQTLALAGEGKASFDTGLPVRNDAWVFHDGDAELIAVADRRELEIHLPLADPNTIDVATTIVVDSLLSTPLFVSLMDVPES